MLTSGATCKLPSRLSRVRTDGHASNADNHATLTDDEFIREFIADVLTELRIQYLIDVVRPYGSIKLMTLAHLLRLSLTEVNGLVLMLILDGRIQGQIDEVDQTLELSRLSESLSHHRALALGQWSAQLENLAIAISGKQSMWLWSSDMWQQIAFSIKVRFPGARRCCFSRSSPHGPYHVNQANARCTPRFHVEHLHCVREFSHSSKSHAANLYMPPAQMTPAHLSLYSLRFW